MNFLWWNVQDFAHYDPDRVSRDRWPSTNEIYQEKLNRVCQVIGTVTAKQKPHLLGFAEITKGALEDVRNRLFPDYEIHKIVTLSLEPDFRLGVLYAPQIGFENADSIIAENVPKNTRSTLSIDLRMDNNLIRFYFCHLTANFDTSSEKSRAQSLWTLGNHIYQFMNAQIPANEVRHCIVVGDMNEEPFGLIENWLYASKSRQKAKSKIHYTDEPVKRFRLYNCSWRMLGENFAHPVPETEREFAGTYFWREMRSWHTFDQVIGSGSLLTNNFPYLDEQNLRIVSQKSELSDTMLGKDGLPSKFDWNEGQPFGISDHLPLVGILRLMESKL